MPYIYPDAFTTTGTRAVDTARWLATMFQPQVDAQTSGGRIYKPVWAAGTTGHPDRARLYNFNTGSLIEDVDVSSLAWPADNAAGWVPFQWSTLRALPANQTFIVAYRTVAGSGWAYENLAPAMPTGADASVVQATGPVANPTAYTGITNSTTLGDVSDFSWRNDFRAGADVEVVQLGSASADVTDVVVEYFGDGAQARHPEALVQQLKAEVDALKTEVDGMRDKQNGATGFDVLNTLAEAIKSGVDGVPGTAIAAIRDIVTNAENDLTTMSAATAGALASVSHDLASVEHHLIDAVLGHAGFPAGTPNTAWTQVDETDFDTQLAWQVAADMYVVNITTVRPGQSVSGFGGLTWYYRLGSWCILNGSLGSTRRFLEFASQVLDDNGRRMPGLAIRCQPGTLGTVQAWTLG